MLKKVIFVKKIFTDKLFVHKSRFLHTYDFNLHIEKEDSHAIPMEST